MGPTLKQFTIDETVPPHLRYTSPDAAGRLPLPEETGLAVVTFHGDAVARGCAFADARTIVAGDEGSHLYFLRLEE